MTELFKEKDEKLVKRIVDLLVKQSNPGEYFSEDRRGTIMLPKSKIKEKTGRAVLRKDALRKLATQFEQNGCTAEIKKDGLIVTSSVETSKKFTLDELRRSVEEGMDEENIDEEE